MICNALYTITARVLLYVCKYYYMQSICITTYYKYHVQVLTCYVMHNT